MPIYPVITKGMPGHFQVVSGKFQVIYMDIDVGAPDLAPEGTMYWDPDDHTLVLVVNGGPRLQVGQEQYAFVRNDTAADMNDGSAVIPTGSVGFRPTVSLAKADNIITSRVAGVLTEDIEKNTQGFAATFGLVRGIDTNAWTEGDILYLSETTAGLMQNTVPTSGYTAAAAMVIRKHPDEGVLFVFPWHRPAFGDIFGGNLTEWAFNGFRRSKGNARAWKDEFGQLTGSRLESPSSRIVLNIPEGAVTFQTNAIYPTDYVILNLQLNHDWDIGQDIDAHIHWFQAQVAIPNFLIEHRWQVNGAAKTTAWTPLAWTGHVFTYPGSGTFNQITEFEPIVPPGGAGLSDILQIRLYRDNTNVSGEFAGADPVGVNVDATFLDGHKRVNTDGSFEEYVKDAP